MCRDIATTIFACGALLIMVLAGCGLFPEEEPAVSIVLPEPPAISADTTYPVERTDMYNQVAGSAVVTPVNSIFLYFTRGGRLTELEAAPRMEVSQGQLLARLDISELEHQLALAELDLQITDLRNGPATLSGLSRVEQQIRALEREKQVLQRDRLERLIAGATIRAPYDGIIDRVFFQLGDTVPEYDTVVELSDPTEVELEVRISATEYEDILPGQRALVAVRRDDWREATVVQTVHRSPSSDPTVNRETYIATVALEDPSSADLTVNSRLSARIVIEESRNTLAIPLGALREFQDDTYVRVLEGQARREVYVRTGIRTETTVEILEGLEEGMLVIGR